MLYIYNTIIRPFVVYSLDILLSLDCKYRTSPHIAKFAEPVDIARIPDGVDVPSNSILMSSIITLKDDPSDPDIVLPTGLQSQLTAYTRNTAALDPSVMEPLYLTYNRFTQDDQDDDVRIERT